MNRFCFVLCWLVALPSVTCADVRDDLQGLKREIKEKRLLIKKSTKVETKVSGELQQIEKTLKEKQAALTNLQREMQKVERNLQEISRESGRVQEEVAHRKELIHRRLRALYKAGDISTVRMLFTAESFPQLSENLQYTKSVLTHDRRLVAEYTQKIDELNRLQARMHDEAARKGKIKKEYEEKAQEIEDEKNRKTSYLHKVRQDKQQHLTTLKELQANARRLQVMIEKLEARSRKSYSKKSDSTAGVDPGKGLPSVPDKGFAAQKGRLSFPVRGDIVSRFGRHKHPEFNSYTVSNGLTISAALGTDIHAVFDGQVIFADYFKGYGNMVIIDHGGGYFSLYSHASKIMKKVGTNISRNETIALVGDSDSADGAKVYFEIRYQGKPVDPMPWFH
jgi:septal ring factor EnvC (AmiA/AmiB activator)